MSSEALSNVRTFRLLVLSCLAAEAALLVLPYSEARFLVGIAAQCFDQNGLDAVFLMPPMVWYGVRIAGLVALVALLASRRVGRHLYSVTATLSVAMAALGGLGVASAMGVTVGYIAAILQGAVLAKSYSSEVDVRLV